MQEICQEWCIHFGKQLGVTLATTVHTASSRAQSVPILRGIHLPGKQTSQRPNADAEVSTYRLKP